ncbi:MAG: DUF2087 domain-containing protein [Candidatus Limnocylindrales bacterium]
MIYRYLRDAVFTEDRPYPEKEVNMRLALFHPDVATIRRGMVDAGLVTRAGGRLPARPGLIRAEAVSGPGRRASSDPSCSRRRAMARSGRSRRHRGRTGWRSALSRR